MERRVRIRVTGWLVALTLSTLAAGATAEEPPRVVDIQGHRGARSLLPENSLPAFALALDLGVSTLELDLGMSADGVLIVTHDPWVDPAICLDSDGRRIEGERGQLIKDLTIEEIRAFDCGSLNPDPTRFPEPPRENRPGTRMPRLTEVFELVHSRQADVRFNIEIKVRPDGDWTRPLPEFVHAVVEAIREAGEVLRTTVQSFDWRALSLVKQREPRLRTSGLLEPESLDARWLGGLDPEAFPDFLALLAAAPQLDDFSPYWRQLVPGEHFLGHEVKEYQSAAAAESRSRPS